MKQNSGTTLFALIVFVSLILIGLVMTWSWNGLISKEEAVITAWSQVESNYQRRADLVPNLVKTVKGFAEQERTVLEQTTEARAQATQNIMKEMSALAEAQGKATALTEGGKDNLSNEDYMKNLARAQADLGARMTQVLAVAENYPNLRSSESFLELQAQLEGTENRINVARMNFNERAEAFNAAIRRFPGSILQGMGDFRRKAYFKADEGTNKAATVDFGTSATH